MDSSLGYLNGSLTPYVLDHLEGRSLEILESSGANVSSPASKLWPGVVLAHYNWYNLSEPSKAHNPTWLENVLEMELDSWENHL